MATVAEIEALLSARDKMSGVIKKAADNTDRETGRMGQMFGGLAKAAAAAGAAAAVAVSGLAVKGLQDFAAFEKQMNEVFTLLPGISGEAMLEMSEQVKDFSKEFAVLPEQVVPALYQAISAGVPKDNVFEFLEVAQKAALGGVTELTTAVDGISSVVNSYGSDVIDAGKASDLMFTAVRLGKTDFEQLSKSLFNVVPTASALGVEFGDVTAALAAMTAQGVPTSVATTQLRQLFVELSKSGGIAASAFEKMSGKTFAEFIAEGGNVADALAVMQEAADKNDKSLQDMFGSVEAGAAALSLTQGTGFTDALDEMGAAAGATDAAYAQMDQGLSRTWDRIKTTFKVALLDLGQKLAPTAQQFSEWFAQKLPGAIEATEKWVKERLVPAVQKLVGWFQDGMSSMGGVSGLLDKLKGSAGSLSEGFVLLGGPLLLIVKELFPLLRPLLDAILPPLAEMANKLAPALGDALGWLVDEILPGFIKIVEAVIGWITDNKGLVVAFAAVVIAFKVLSAVMAVNPFILLAIAVLAIAALIITNWDTIKAFLSRTWESIKSVAYTVWGAIKGFFSSALDFVKHLFLNWTGPGLIIKHWDTIKAGALAVKDWIVDKFNAVVTFFTRMPGRIRRAVGGLFNGIKNAFRSAVNWVIDKWNRLSLGINLPSIFGGGRIALDTPNIPRFHEGGVFRAPTGQREGLAVLEDGERVTPEGAAPVQNFYFNGIAPDPFAVGNAIAWRLKTQGV